MARSLGGGVSIVCQILEHLDGFANYARYFGDHDIDGMFATLTPLHDDLGRVSTSTYRMSDSILIL